MIPVGVSSSSPKQEQVLEYSKSLVRLLTAAGIRAHLDNRDRQTAGFKFNYWELKGLCRSKGTPIPLYLKIGLLSSFTIVLLLDSRPMLALILEAC